MNKKKIISALLMLAVVGGTAWFFVNEFVKNWDKLTATSLEYNYIYLCLAFIFLLIAHYFSTKAWQSQMNRYATHNSINFMQSMAIVNTSRLTKYLPGKLWSFALQIWWLSERGFPKSAVFFVNLVSTISSIMATTFAGVMLFSITSGFFTIPQIISLIFICVLIYTIFIVFHNQIINLSVRFINFIFKKNIAQYKISFIDVIIQQILYTLGALAFAAGVYFICPGIGIFDNTSFIITVSGAVLLSEVVGFVILIAPGGLGVRESLLYLVLGKLTALNPALLFPVALRVITMITDVIIGVIGYILFAKFKRKVN